MNLHPYDGVERRFRHDDPSPEQGLALVERLLGVSLPRPLPTLHYDLSFYSGGIGVLDHLRVSVALDSAAAIVRGRGLQPLTGATGPVWFVDEEEAFTPAHLAAFVEENRAPFQAPVGADAWFDPDSDVNAWTLVYYAAGAVHYLAYDQG